ncbi:protein eiger [Uranotaenia lowii]|uniref:protein eiger n=1 Tax=Uranotaenia lowii TaxID=190385 RepID=UPI002479E373|nr:protein eiger [Uranotaenia lowii]
MTVEALKPFLSASPNSGLVSLPPECSKKKSVKNFVLICGSAILLVLTVAVLGLEIWNINRIADLQREVDGLRQQMHELRQLRLEEGIEDFNDFEQAYDTNDIHRHSDEYEEEEEELDADVEEEEEGSTVFGEPDFNVDDMETEISVTASATNSMLSSSSIDGKRRARSITGITYQGVPIMEESYMSRNRTRHHQQLDQQQQELARHQPYHHPRRAQFQQMRQRPEETASAPPQLKLKWDDDGREIPTHHQQQLDNNDAGRNSARRHHQTVHHRATTTESSGHQQHQHQSVPSPSAIPSYVRRNEFARSSGKLMETTRPNQVGPDYTTKSPGPTHDRRSRVMLTNAGENKYQKVIKNPGTYMESRQPPVQRVGRLVRKSAALPRVTALHLAKYHHHYPNNVRATNHATWHWHPVDTANMEALRSGVFKLTHNGSLIVNDTGLFFVYAQITYNDQNPTSGFNILVNGKKHVSCSIHGPQGKKTNACYTAALIDLENGSTLEIRDMDENRIHLPYQEKTFFGLYKLGRRPVVASNT